MLPFEYHDLNQQPVRRQTPRFVLSLVGRQTWLDDDGAVVVDAVA
jgi:hypothetical protein